MRAPKKKDLAKCPVLECHKDMHQVRVLGANDRHLAWVFQCRKHGTQKPWQPVRQLSFPEKWINGT